MSQLPLLREYFLDWEYFVAVLGGPAHACPEGGSDSPRSSNTGTFLNSALPGNFREGGRECRVTREAR